jgi:hypothetical protein
VAPAPSGGITDDGPEWTDDAEESPFLAEAAGRGEAGAPAAGRAVAAPAPAKLPPLEDLVLRVPAEVRAVLDELFRAKFTKVRRFAPAPGTEASP